MKPYRLGRLAGFLLCFLFISWAGLNAQEKTDQGLLPLIDQLDKTASQMVQGQHASLTIGLVKKTGLVWTKSYGYADIEKKELANIDSVYRIGSITKQFTALMLLQLVHQGKVHFSDPVEKYFPEIQLVKSDYKNAPPVTLAELALHRSGLDVEPDSDIFMQGPVSDWEKVLIAALPHTKYAHEPGRYFAYSNIGYAILGAALERAAHQPYTDYIKENILRPLKMTHTDFEPTPAIREHLATGYEHIYPDRLDRDRSQKEQAGRGYKVPNGALYTTVDDLARFEAFEMLGGPEAVLPGQELEEARGQVSANDNLSAGYGLGVQFVRSGENVFLGHTGSVAGYTALAFVQLRAGVGIVVLRNEDGPEIQKLLDVFTQNLEVKH